MWFKLWVVFPILKNYSKNKLEHVLGGKKKKKRVLLSF